MAVDCEDIKVYIYLDDEDGWVQLRQGFPPDSNKDLHYGSMSSDGQTLALIVDDRDRIVVKVFRLLPSGGTSFEWFQLGQTLENQASAELEFLIPYQRQVSLSGDGIRLAVVAGDADNETSLLRVFEFDETWQPINVTTEKKFLREATLSRDGSTLIAASDGRWDPIPVLYRIQEEQCPVSLQIGGETSGVRVTQPSLQAATLAGLSLLLLIPWRFLMDFRR